MLLIDSVSSGRPTDILSEAKIDSRGVMYVSGVIQRADAPNQNKRIYPKSVLKREVEKYMDAVRSNQATGELDHPATSELNLKNVCHRLVDIWWTGDDLMGRCEILPTHAGNTLKALIESNVQVGISSRGNGTVTKEKGSEYVTVNDDFELVCWDFVSNPSTHGAWMYLEESKVRDILKSDAGLLSHIISLG